MSYEPFERLIAPARATSGLRHLIAGSMALVAFVLLFSYGFASLQARVIPADATDQFFSDLVSGATALTVLINLFSFALMIVALWLAVRLVHRRSLAGLVGDLGLALFQFRRVIIAIILFYLASALFLPVPDTFQPSQNMFFNQWVLLLPLTLFGLLVQVSAEELVFRGYLQSQLAARFDHPAIWLIVPSVLFGLLHLDTQSDPLFAWSIVLWATLFGVAAADLTARSGTLGPAIALHLVNNFFAIAISAPDGNFDGLALYTVPIDNLDPGVVMQLMPVEIMMLLCTWLAARVALRR